MAACAEKTLACQMYLFLHTKPWTCAPDPFLRTLATRKATSFWMESFLFPHFEFEVRHGGRTRGVHFSLSGASVTWEWTPCLQQTNLLGYLIGCQSSRSELRLPWFAGKGFHAPIRRMNWPELQFVSSSWLGALFGRLPGALLSTPPKQSPSRACIVEVCCPAPT